MDDEAKEILRDIGIQTHNPDGTKRTEEELIQEMLRVAAALEEVFKR